MSGPSTEAHPIDPAIRGQIMQKLEAVERDHQVRVLFACESGSRGWGFASPDSDYDVRFLYVHRVDEYLRVLPGRDVIEEVPGPVFDVNGWDLRKALGLLAKGNATLIEWLSSPVVYRQDDAFVSVLREAAAKVYRPIRSFHHYYSMARGNYREYLQGDLVRAKKYLYVLRPILAAQWVCTKPTMPPMAFESLVSELIHDPAVLDSIAVLLEQKRRVGEAELLPRIAVLNTFIEDSLAELQRRAEDDPPSDGDVDMSVLDELFFKRVMDGR
jgi:uncharacterized protein